MENLIILLLGLFAIIIIIVFTPKYGLYIRIRNNKRKSSRINMEDALKHLHDYEQQNLDATLNSIAGNLSITTDKASGIVNILQKLGLIKVNNQVVNLTKDGRKYALRIIRTHRLWESYLAEETGMRELDWHESAEEIEHTLSSEEADLLAAKIGNPKFDPHGDPIPSLDGSYKNREIFPLNTIEQNSIVEIKHIEDEPKIIYQKLLKQGLHPGTKLKVNKVKDDNVEISINGNIENLSSLQASKVTVKVLDEVEFENKKMQTLKDLKVGEEARVIKILPNCRGLQRRRLLDFGIVHGANISVHMGNPLDDPRAYLVKETLVALRKTQAEKILVEK